MKERENRYVDFLNEMNGMRKTFREIAIGHYERKVLRKKREEKKKRLNRRIFRVTALSAGFCAVFPLLFAGIQYRDPLKIAVETVAYPQEMTQENPKFEKISMFVQGLLSGNAGSIMSGYGNSLKLRSIFAYSGQEKTEALCENTENGERFLLSLETDRSDAYVVSKISRQ